MGLEKAYVTAACAAQGCKERLVTCRGALLADQAALEQWKTSSPLLIMGSHRWNIPNSKGQIACGGERQAKLLQAVRYRYQQLLLYTRLFGILLHCVTI